jgi:hypothetical protein
VVYLTGSGGVCRGVGYTCRADLAALSLTRTLPRLRAGTRTPSSSLFLQGVTRVASNTSKTARASVRAGQAGAGGALSVLGEFKYVIPLNGGKHAYVRNLTNGKTLHLRTDSDQFIEEIRTLATAGHGVKIRAELSALAATHPDHGWDATEKRLVEAGVFEG